MILLPIDDLFNKVPVPKLAFSIQAIRNTFIPNWIIKARPDQVIAMRQFSIPLFVDNIVDMQHSLQRFAEIEYEVSEELGYWP